MATAKIPRHSRAGCGEKRRNEIVRRPAADTGRSPPAEEHARLPPRCPRPGRRRARSPARRGQIGRADCRRGRGVEVRTQGRSEDGGRGRGTITHEGSPAARGLSSFCAELPQGQKRACRTALCATKGSGAETAFFQVSDYAGREIKHSSPCCFGLPVEQLPHTPGRSASLAGRRAGGISSVLCRSVARAVPRAHLLGKGKQANGSEAGDTNSTTP